MIRAKGFILVLVFLLSSGSAAAQQPFRIIVHPDNPAMRLTSEEASRLFLKREARWPDGVAVEPVDLAGTNALRESFSVAVHGRSTARILAYWQQKVFSGELAPPPEVGNEDEVVQFVRSRRGAVGYISDGRPLEGVKKVPLTIPPKRLSHVVPVYTSRARTIGVVGAVVLLVSIDATGKVTDVEVVSGLPYGLDEAAVRAVRNWTYQPALTDGKPVAAQIEVTVHFQP